MQIQLEIPAGHPLAGLLAEAQFAERHADFYDILSLEIRREIDEATRSRLRTEALIDRLITGLDALDDDPDLEPYLGDGDDREGEVGRDGDFEPDADAEWAACETYGCGFTANGGEAHDDAEDDDPGGCEHDGREPDLGW